MRNALLLTSAVLLASGAVTAAEPARIGPLKAHYEVTVRDIPAGSAKARVWLVLPPDVSGQRVDDFKTTGKVQTGGSYEDNRFAYFEVDNPGPMLTLSAECVVERREVHVVDDPEAAARNTEPLNERSLRFYGEDLKAGPGSPVGGRFAALGAEIVGSEKNPVLRARKVYDWVVAHVKPIEAKQEEKGSLTGDATHALTAKAGTSADIAALFASLGRSLNIPVRIVSGVLLPGGDPGVPSGEHFWAEFFALGIGWVPVDPALAMRLPAARRAFYFGNLDARRITLCYGVAAKLAPPQDAGPADLTAGVYVEVDGKPHNQLHRRYDYDSRR